MQNKIAIRTIIGLLAIAAMVLGFQRFKDFAKDPDVGVFDSVGVVAVIEQTPNGSRVLLIDPSGKETAPPSPDKKRFDDREVSWSADGQRLFLSSTRESDAYNVYRWNPAKNKVERRSTGSRSQSAPQMATGSNPEERTNGLILAGGTVLALNAREGTTVQVLPPTMLGTTASGEEGEGGRVSAMESLYRKFGDSFRLAMWAGNETDIFAMMRNDDGDVVIQQQLGADIEGNPFQPIELMRATRLYMDVAKNGKAVVSVQFFQFPPDNIPPEFIKNGKVTKPFLHGLFLLEFGKDGRPVQPQAIFMPQPYEPIAFGDVAISPDGTKLAAVIGEIDKKTGDFISRGLAVMPFELGGGQNGTPLMPGDLSQPTWSADGSKIYVVQNHDGFSDLVEASLSGGQPKPLTNGKHVTSPKASPQLTTPAK